MRQSFGNSPGSPKEILGTISAAGPPSDDVICVLLSFLHSWLRSHSDPQPKAMNSEDEAVVVEAFESRLDVEESDRFGDVGSCHFKVPRRAMTQTHIFHECHFEHGEQWETFLAAKKKHIATKGSLDVNSIGLDGGWRTWFKRLSVNSQAPVSVSSTLSSVRVFEKKCACPCTCMVARILLCRKNVVE